MSFATSLRSFAQQSARERTAAFVGEADAQGRNLSLPVERDGATVEHKFRAAFTRLSSVYTLRSHGRSLRVSASIMLPDSLGLSVDENTRLTHLPTGDVYEVVQIGVEHPGAAEKRVLLARLED